MKKIMVFPRIEEFRRAKDVLDAGSQNYDVLDPGSTYVNVAVPALVFDPEALSVLFAKPGEVYCSGFVDARDDQAAAFDKPTDYEEDIFGKALIQVVSPCIADERKIRLIAHISGNILPAMPYLNAVTPSAFYSKNAGILTFMEQYRLISIYSSKITMAKVDGIPDAWRVLEKIRRMVNKTWKDRHQIEPSDEVRKKPPALEIYYRLPRTNCGQCGLQSCMAFALTLWGGNISPSACRPINEGDYRHLRDAYLDILSGFIM